MIMMIMTCDFYEAINKLPVREMNLKKWDSVSEWALMTDIC